MKTKVIASLIRQGDITIVSRRQSPVLDRESMGMTQVIATIANFLRCGCPVVQLVGDKGCLNSGEIEEIKRGLQALQIPQMETFFVAGEPQLFDSRIVVSFGRTWEPIRLPR